MATEPKPHPTIVDVARIANVAPSTASRALKENPRISESTRERVKAVARDLGYQPNRLAQSLRGRDGTFVGIVVPDIGIGFYSLCVKGAQDLLESEGHHVLLMNTGRDAKREQAALETLLEHRVRGVIVATSVRQTAAPRVPTVFFDNLVPEHGVANVALANHEGMDVLVRHLVEHGHTRVGYIGGPPTFTSGMERLDSFRDAVARLGLDERRRYIELADAQWTPASGARAMRRLAALEEPPTAVITSGDTLALGAMSACRELGLRMPEDMALVSFDDPFFGDLLDPPITALARSEIELGRLAAALLLRALETGVQVSPTEVRLPVELVVRRSCGCGVAQ